MTTYPYRQPITSGNYEAHFANIFGGMPDPDPVIDNAVTTSGTARVIARVKPQDGHRRTVTPDSMADWMRDHPGATRAEMLLEFTELEIAGHFDAARRIWSRTLAA